MNTWVSFQSAEQPLLGQFSVSGNNLSALVGTYCDPSMLGADLNIVVRLGDGREVFEDDRIGRLTFDELIMVMEDA
ncbi:TPA: hypothetical protein MX429_006388 [Pseudomonas aeruginosa]|nr:hypothetical protein [Pseudomonas aeruginosa]